jgi:hypothetical protein
VWHAELSGPPLDAEKLHKECASDCDYIAPIGYGTRLNVSFHVLDYEKRIILDTID